MQRVQIALAAVALVGCTGVVDREAPSRIGEESNVQSGNSCLSNESPHLEVRYRAPAHPRSPRRAMLMLQGALSSAAAYDAPIPGFNCLDRAAEAGYDAYAISYQGSGTSSYPADGWSAAPNQMLQDAATALEWVRGWSGVDRVDLFGSSIGSLLAMQLGSDGSPVPLDHVGGLVLTGVVYGNAPARAFPPVKAAVCGDQVVPGYVTSDADVYAPLLLSAVPAVAAWAQAVLPGTYAEGPFLALFSLSSFDARHARAPALQIWGDRDPITSASDVALFQSQYAGPLQLFVVPGGGHVPYYEPGADAVWAVTFDFLDRVHAVPAPSCGQSAAINETSL